MTASTLDVADVTLRYRFDGPAGAPVLVLSNSLGTTLSMWDLQVPALSRTFRVLRYDTRGHGQSERGAAPLTLETLGGDVVGLLDALAIPRAHFCGISMGAMTGQWLGVHRPQRLDRLVLANTAARIGTAAGWIARAAQVRADGMDGVADGAAARWFTPAFIARAPHRVARMIARLREQEREGYAACCAALAEADLRPGVATISATTLVIAGDQDPVTTVADGEWLAGAIRAATLAVVPASHISNIEADGPFTTHLLHFLAA